MKSTEQIERLLRKLELEPNGEKRKRTRRDLMEAQARRRENKTPVSRRGVFRRAMMTVRARRIAATVALALLLFAALGVGTGSMALSQTQHAVNTTLAWLKSMIVGGPQAPPPGADETARQTPDLNRREVTCAARLFKVPEDEQGLWQFLRDQGIELVRVSTDPEVSYATLSREQTQSFDASTTLKCLSAPRFTVRESDSGAIAIKDMTPQGPQGLAVGWRPAISSDGTRIESTISFHDGRSGFEIPNASTESGGAVLIRAKGIWRGLGEDRGGSWEVLIRVLMTLP